MIKCLFYGHNWVLKDTYTGKRISFQLFGKSHLDHDLTKEYYTCTRCGMWKCKTFVDHEILETKYYKEKPYEQGK